MPPHLKKMLSTSAVAALLLCIAIAAYVHRGVPAAQVELNDGGVWVTNQTMNLVAHLNYPSRTLDGGLRPGSSDFDVEQGGSSITLINDKGSAIHPIEGSTMTLGAPAKLNSFRFSQGGQTGAVVDVKEGRVWALPASAIGEFSAQSKPLVEKLSNPQVAVSRTGTVLILNADGKITAISGVNESTPKVKSAGSLKTVPDRDAVVQLSAVGDELVVLDTTHAKVLTTRGTWEIPQQTGLRLQQPGPESDRVVVAGPSALYTAALSGGSVTTISSDGPAGTAAQPVVVKGCTYAAWGGSGRYLRDCPGQSDDQKIGIKLSAKPPVFRVNRDLVVLNDTHSGTIYLVNNQMQIVDNWQDLTSQVKDQAGEEDQRGDSFTERVKPKRTQENHPPVAVDDNFGVRPGRSTTLPVILNDNDPDGDILTARPSKTPLFGSIGLIRGGEALQFTCDAKATGSQSLQYEVSDGRGGTAKATINLTVKPLGENTPPKQVRKPNLSMGSGSEISYNVLPDWLDPEGDPIFLVNAVAPEGMSVHVRPDGLLTIKDLGTASPGLRDIQVTIDDGQKSTTGPVRVNVMPVGNRAPVANPDHAQVVVGHEVLISPLFNDTDPNGDPLSLTSVGKPEGGLNALISMDSVKGTFTFRADQEGTYYVPYSVSDGPAVADGVVRVDVLSDKARNEPPVAEPDFALMPASGAVTVDALANDTDPLGGVLVVQSVQIPEGARYSVEVIDHGRLRVSAPQGIDGTQEFTYTVSNGSSTAQGHVAVKPLPESLRNKPPVAVQDAAEVRAGDIVSVHVLDNDNSPSGLPLEVDQALQLDHPELGTAFVSNNLVRFKAHDKSKGLVRITYTARDTAGNFNSAEVVVRIRPLEEDPQNRKNSPPQPRPVVARALAGSEIKIYVPTDGIDPDGDSVTLTGLDSLPSLGTASVEAGALIYRPQPAANGTDYFSYTVADRFGARATATIAVGVARPATINLPPVAVPDMITARPGRLIDVAVAANDIDPDGGKVVVVPGSISPVDKTNTVPAKDENGYLRLTTPQQEIVLQYYYEISDPLGATAKGVATIDVRKDAPLRAPIARDDRLSETDISGKDTVEVDVLKNDEDPDGSSEDLKIAVEDSQTARVEGSKIKIKVTEERQVIVYSITDSDNLVGKAVVIVPSNWRKEPILLAEKTPAKVKAGELLTIPLGDFVRTRDGRQPKLTYADKVKVGVGGNGDNPIKDAQTLQFRSTKDFIGPTSMSFEVTDGSGAEDKQGLSSILTLPILVESSGLHQPVPHPSEVAVAAGEPDKAVDLAALVTDVDPGDQERLKFTVEQAPNGFKANLRGTTLDIGAAADIAPGTVGQLSLTVTDQSTAPVTFQIPLRAAPTSRPMMTVRQAEINDAKAGSASRVDINAYVSNPFASDGKPVTLVGQPTVSQGQGSVSATGTNLAITPNVGYHGQMLVTYRVADATNLASRQVIGTVQLTVRDKPEAPTAVSAVSNASHTATVSWTAGANNGAPITNFTVSWAGGSRQCGAVTTCSVTDLINDKPHIFTVKATNDVGDSRPSAASNEVRPDVKPNTPDAPNATFGDRQVSLNWPVTPTDGSPVTSYTVEISPAPGGAAPEKTVNGTSLVWAGLENGTAYRFRIQAKNKSPQPSEWSPYSAPEIPAGVPKAPNPPTVQKAAPSNLPPAATVSWIAPDGNGDSAMTYEMRRNGGSVIYSGTALSAQTNLMINTTDQTFAVRAKNKAGWGEWSGPSLPVRGWQLPPKVANFSAVPTGESNQIKITFDAVTVPGVNAHEIKYYWRAGSAQAQVANGQVITNGVFANGVNISISVWAEATVNGEKGPGPAAVAQVNAYGPPAAPAISAVSGPGRVTFNWDATSSGRGRPVSQVEYRGAQTGTGQPSGSVIGNATYPEQLCLEARALSEGKWSAWGRTCGTPKKPNARFFRGDEYPTCPVKNIAGKCYDISIEASDYNPNSTIECYVDGTQGLPTWRDTYQVDGNGYIRVAKTKAYVDGVEALNQVGCSQK